ncbi:MAG: diguanylate cyclase [Gammaproteobacteria bacterium]|nr:diguanylate cyclase [Gammaproteobacteria bacterium]
MARLLVDQTLAEQLHITELEIQQRKALVGFEASDAEILRHHRVFIAEHVEEIVQRFYDKQTAIREIALLIGDTDTLGRLHGAMRRYVLELFDGYYDSEYINRRLRIGKVHKQIGVPPKLYVSAVWSLQNTICDCIDDYTGKINASELGKVLKAALGKLFILDIGFVFDTYIASLISEIRLAKQETEDYAKSLKEQVVARTQELEKLSRRDGLTGLWNHNAFQEYLYHELAHAERYKETLALAYVDIDNFKRLNDSKGHIVGDKVLCTLANIIREKLRQTDIACRVGGDEFTIIFPHTSMLEASLVCERIIDALRGCDIEGCTVSFGLASVGPERYDNALELIQDADMMMYKSKARAHKQSGFYITQQETNAENTAATISRIGG